MNEDKVELVINNVIKKHKHVEASDETLNQKKLG